MRSDVTFLRNFSWMYCVLDEGHLIKNPKTATAKAARCLRSRHKIILSGSPVQNKVQELWATFDWLMPNYLGSDSDFAKRFGRDITKSQLPGASIGSIRKGMNKLKILHQQVLPFILRREKGEVLQQLPAKIITDVPCFLSDEQSSLYKRLCDDEVTQNAMDSLESLIKTSETSENNEVQKPIGKHLLRSLMRLRMLCTHPILLNDDKNPKDYTMSRFNASGKLCTLCDLLRNAGIFNDDITAVDNDQSLIYVQNLDTDSNDPDNSINFEPDDGVLGGINGGEEQVKHNGSKCLIFAQFTNSLDVIEELLFKPLMPSLRYLRLDGRIDPGHRELVIKQFVSDESITCLLLTTKVGSLGLNLQVANTVIFLEADYNPHVDLQAMDRVHRIGQDKVRIEEYQYEDFFTNIKCFFFIN